MKPEYKTMNAQSFGKRKTAPQSVPVRTAASVSSSVSAMPLPAPAADARHATPEGFGSNGATSSVAPATPTDTNVGERADLAVFFGPGADKYLRVYDKLIANPHSISFNWAVFSSAFVWFFYRKLYLMGAVFVIVPLVMTYVLPFGVGLSGCVFACFADRVYVREAKRHIRDASDLGLTGEERTAYLHRAGGVSPQAGIVAGLFYAGMGALAFLQ
jgi:hypothetical protein